MAQLSIPIRITLDISVVYLGTNRTFTMVRVHNGVATELVDLDDDTNTITFETNHPYWAGCNRKVPIFIVYFIM